MYRVSLNKGLEKRSSKFSVLSWFPTLGIKCYSYHVCFSIYMYASLISITRRRILSNYHLKINLMWGDGLVGSLVTQTSGSVLEEGAQAVGRDSHCRATMWSKSAASGAPWRQRNPRETQVYSSIVIINKKTHQPVRPNLSLTVAINCLSVFNTVINMFKSF